MKHFTSLLYTVIFWGFIVIKWLGVSLAGWSWWWALVPIVPMLSLVVTHLGL